jgi:hypothetical protein
VSRIDYCQLFVTPIRKETNSLRYQDTSSISSYVAMIYRHCKSILNHESIASQKDQKNSSPSQDENFILAEKRP